MQFFAVFLCIYAKRTAARVIVMTHNFQSIKKKYLRQAIIAAIALGVFFGLFIACALLLAFKLSEIELLWVYYVLIGLGAAAISAYPFYLLLRPDDRKLAKKLDTDYGLNQKVQTMVEFSGESGAMAILQREQTDQALTAAAAKRPSARSLLKFIFIPVLAVGIAFAGIFVPAKKSTVYVPPFTISSAQEAALKNLIADVGSSDLGEGLKASAAGALESLLGKLKETSTQSEMKRLVISTVKGIDATIANSNSYVFLYNQLRNDDYTKSFATAMLNGVVYYKLTSASEIKNMEIVGRKSEMCNEAITEKLQAWVAGVRETFYNTVEENAGSSSETSKVIMSVLEMKARLGDYSQAFAAGLEAAAFPDGEDALCSAISAFAENIDVPIQSGYGSESYLTLIEQTCNAFITPACEDALYVQSYNCIMDEFIRNELARIFGLSLSELGSNANVAPEPVEEDGEGDGEGTHGGSGGSGENIYGSDDMVLDPDSGELVTYGKLLAQYQAKIQERLKEYERLASKEDATPEEKAAAKYVQSELTRYINLYIDRLFNDSQS